MAKYSYPNRMFLLFLVMIFIPCLIFALPIVPGALHPLTIEYIAVSTDSPVFAADTAAQKAVPASQSSITTGNFKFRIVRVGFDETAMGFVPANMGKGDQVMFVESELLTGNIEAFKSLEITVSHGSGQKSKAFILISGGMMQMLATVTMKGASSDYQPGEDNVTWAYVVPKGADKLYLNFPTGEVIDLIPFIKRQKQKKEKEELS
jgi:hypothetical protein